MNQSEVRTSGKALTLYYTILHLTLSHISGSTKLKDFVDDNFEFDEMGQSSVKGWKTLSEKEKLLFMSNFLFSHSVFKRPVLQTSKNKGLFGRGLNDLVKQSIMTKEENVGHQHVSPFPPIFSTVQPKTYFTL